MATEGVPFDNVLVYYGHGSIKMEKRQPVMIKVPAGKCVVSIVDASDTAWESQQQAFHALCKLANSRSHAGRMARTWLHNPILYKNEIENEIDRFRPAYSGGATKIHIASGDFEDDDIKNTPYFEGSSYTDDTRTPPEGVAYDIDICKSGLYFFEEAGAGKYHVINRVEKFGSVYLDDVLNVYKGAEYPTLDHIVESQLKCQEADEEDWEDDSEDERGPVAHHTVWKDCLNHDDDILVDPDTVFDLLDSGERAGHRGVFYNLACRVIMKKDIANKMTRAVESILKKVKNDEAAASTRLAELAAEKKGKVAATAAAAGRSGTFGASSVAIAGVQQSASAKLAINTEAAKEVGMSLNYYRQWQEILKTGDRNASDKIWWEGHGAEVSISGDDYKTWSDMLQGNDADAASNFLKEAQQRFARKGSLRPRTGRRGGSKTRRTRKIRQ